MVKLESETEYITRCLDIRKIEKFDKNTRLSSYIKSTSIIKNKTYEYSILIENGKFLTDDDSKNDHILKLETSTKNKYFNLSHLFQFIDYNEDLFYVNVEKLENQNITITYGDADENCILITEANSDKAYNVHIVSSFDKTLKEKTIGKKIRRLNLILGEQNYGF